MKNCITVSPWLLSITVAHTVCYSLSKNRIHFDEREREGGGERERVTWNNGFESHSHTQQPLSVLNIKHAASGCFWKKIKENSTVEKIRFVDSGLLNPKYRCIRVRILRSAEPTLSLRSLEAALPMVFWWSCMRCRWVELCRLVSKEM